MKLDQKKNQGKIMLWKRKNKLPITNEDKIWVDENIDWLKDNLGVKHFLSIKTVTPTKNFFEKDYYNPEKKAEYFLQTIMNLMSIKNLDVEIEYFSDNLVKMDDGRILTSPADINGGFTSAAGAYEMNEKGFKLYIERQQLKDPVSLVATISHELAHEILLGENRIKENDEYLTDLTAIVYGFGIFIGNSNFRFSQYSLGNSFGWDASSQGYLPEQIIAYAMAKLSICRNENTSYGNFLNKGIKKYFDQSLEWLKQNNM